MKLREVNGWDDDEDFVSHDLSYLGFNLEQEQEREEDNMKIWHTAIMPDGKRVTLDHSPYEMITPNVFKLYVLFFKQHKRFPTRADIKSNGPIHDEDMERLSR